MALERGQELRTRDAICDPVIDRQRARDAVGDAERPIHYGRTGLSRTEGENGGLRRDWTP